MRIKALMVLLPLFFALFASAQTPVIDSLKKIIAQGKRDSVEVQTDIKLVDELLRSDLGEAKRYALRAVALCKQLNSYSQLSASYSQLTTLNGQINQTDSAKYYLNLLKELATDHKSYRTTSNYNFTAGLFYHKQGNYKAALPFMLECLRIYTADGTKIGMAGQNLNIGNCYQEMGDYRRAMASHLKALGLFEDLGNKRGMSFCYAAVGADFIKLEQFTAALPYIQKSLVIKDELNDKRGKASSFTNLGQLEDGLQQPDKALASYMEALAINKALKLTTEEAKTDIDIGKLYVEKKDIANATEYFNRSRDLLKQSGDTAYMATVNSELNSLQKNLNNEKSTENTFIQSIATALKMGDKAAEITNYKYLADFYAGKGQFDNALTFYKKFHDESERVQNTGLQLEVKELEQRYNLEKKEREITLLQKNELLDKANLRNQTTLRYGLFIVILMLITIGVLVMARFRILQKAKRLVEIEKMRNAIARNLHDDIGSTLSSINILSKVALKQAGGNALVTRDLETIKDSSFSIMESMGDIVWAINPANDPFDKTIIKMRQFAATILEPAGIDYTFNEQGRLDDMKIGVDERKNVYLIFKEAINNIAKYSGAATAHIELNKTGHQFLLKITDNGKGFDIAREYSGNGLKNMRNRASEMNAAYEIKSGATSGTTIFITLPIT